jgi:hypothetical protein
MAAAPPGSRLLAAGKLLMVDGVYGDDATAARESVGLAFRAPNAAQAAALAGDCVRVRPGTYALAAPLGKDGVNWLLDPGVTFNNPTGPVWSAAAAMTFAVRGGAFTSSAVGGAGVVEVAHAAAAVTVEGATLAGAADSVQCVRITAGALTLRDCRLLSSSDAGAVAHAGGATRLERCRVEDAAGGAPAAAATAAGLVLDRCVLVSGGPCVLGTLLGIDPVPVVNYGSVGKTAPDVVAELVMPIVVSPNVQ